MKGLVAAGEQLPAATRPVPWFPVRLGAAP